MTRVANKLRNLLFKTCLPMHNEPALIQFLIQPCDQNLDIYVNYKMAFGIAILIIPITANICNKL